MSVSPRKLESKSFSSEKSKSPLRSSVLEMSESLSMPKSVVVSEPSKSGEVSISLEFYGSEFESMSVLPGTVNSESKSALPGFEKSKSALPGFEKSKSVLPGSEKSKSVDPGVVGLPKSSYPIDANKSSNIDRLSVIRP